MSKDNNSENENVFPKKWAKVLEDLPEFKESAEASSKEDLNKIIIQCEGNIYTVEKEKECDTKLNAAKDLVKDYMTPYRDAVKVQMAKIKYALYLLDQSGVNLDNQ